MTQAEDSARAKASGRESVHCFKDVAFSQCRCPAPLCETLMGLNMGEAGGLAGRTMHPCLQSQLASTHGLSNVFSGRKEKEVERFRSGGTATIFALLRENKGYKLSGRQLNQPEA